MTGTILIAYIYNNNGMATWCIEAAKALSLTGYKVILVKKRDIELDVASMQHIQVVNFDEESSNNSNIFNRINAKLKQYIYLIPFIQPDNQFLPKLFKHLSFLGINQVDAILLNQSNLLNHSLQIKQYVVAWANPPFFINYLKNAFTTAKSIQQIYQGVLAALFWYKSDLYSYKNAAGVMSVSENLKNNILRIVKNTNVYTIYPGVSNQYITEIKRPIAKKIKLVMMALHIEEKRKRLTWAINQIQQLQAYYHLIELTLIGDYSASFKRKIEHEKVPVIFLGKLSRHQALNELQKNDLMIFASSVDDWGYVQIEAMSCGLAVMAPKASPFDEIIGNDDYLFDNNDFIEKLQKIIINPVKLETDKQYFLEKYNDKFSGNVFAEKLINIINTTA
jgi:glycosyltransferase involved in cell wall biosynthesis